MYFKVLLIFDCLFTGKLLIFIELWVSGFLASKLVVRFLGEGIIEVSFAENSLRLKAVVERKIVWLFARNPIDRLSNARDLFRRFWLRNAAEVKFALFWLVNCDAITDIFFLFLLLQLGLLFNIEDLFVSELNQFNVAFERKFLLSFLERLLVLMVLFNEIVDGLLDWGVSF